MAKIEARSEVMGLVAQIESKVGDLIAAGDAVMFIESMKMQIPVMVEDTGTLREILERRGMDEAPAQRTAKQYRA